MADKERVYPVKRLVLHHSLGPTFKDMSALEIQDWFNECGRGWGYANYCKKNGLDIDKFDTGHLHPARDKQTFAQVQYALHEYKGGWRLVLLMRDAWGSVAWHADQWTNPETKEFHIGPINQESIGVEVCGNYTNKQLPTAALQVLVNGFIDHARNLKLKGVDFLITGHRDHADTLCPGMIYTQIPTLVDMFADELAK